MKEKLKYLLLLILLIPIGVKADMGAPTIFSVDVVCNVKDGCPVYEYDNSNKDNPYKVTKTVDFGTKYTVEYDFTYEGVTYLSSGDGYLKKDDFVSTKDSVDPTDSKFTKYDYEVRGYVINKNGLDLLSGPNAAFNSVAKIPFGTSIRYKYVLKDLEGGWGVTYVYVEYNGKKGWLHVPQGDLATELKEEVKLKFVEDFKYNKSSYKEGDTTSSKFASYDGGSSYYYLIFDTNNPVVVNSDKVATSASGTITLTKKTKIYSDYKLTKVAKEIDKSKTVNLLYAIETYIEVYDQVDYLEYVKIDGVEGWLDPENEGTANGIKYQSATFANEKGTYVEPNEPPTSTKPGERPTTEEVKTTKQADKKKDNNISINPLTLAIICVGVGLLLLSLVIVIIILINKNKSKVKE